MSLGSDALPAWMFMSEFNDAFDAMKRQELTISEFYDVIKDLDYVPDYVKQIWKGEIE